jgi:hypothetical protein
MLGGPAQPLAMQPWQAGGGRRHAREAHGGVPAQHAPRITRDQPLAISESDWLLEPVGCSLIVCIRWVSQGGAGLWAHGRLAGSKSWARAPAALASA